jgi:hypothetical protein
MFDEIKGLPEKFGEVFAQQSMKMVANTCNFHIGVAHNGKVCYDVNGVNPELVAKGFVAFRDALKKVGMI